MHSEQATHWRVHLLVLCAYTACTLLVVAPVLPHFTAAIPGGAIAAVDGWQNVWSMWWNQQALATVSNPFHTDKLFYPDGADLYLQPIHVSNGFLLAPVTALAGPIAGYNLAVLLAFVLSGVGGYALALRVSRNHVAAFIGGLAFTFSPFHLTTLWNGQLELVAIQWLAWYVFFLLLVVEHRRWRDAVVSGVMLALIGYTSWYYFLCALLYSLLFVALWLLGRTLNGQRGRLLACVVAVGGVGGLLLLPVLVPAFATLYQATEVVEARDAADVVRRSANLVDFVLPSYLHPLWGEQLFTNIALLWHPLSGDWNAALGYGVLMLAVVGGVFAWAAAWRWWVLAGMALVFALGPQLHVGTMATDVPLPYALLLQLPGATFGRRPVLFIGLATLALAPLVALGLRELLGRTRPTLRPVLLAGVVAVLVFEFAPPRWPLQRAEVNAYYATLRTSDGAVLDIPPPRYKRVAPQQAQLVHQRPIFGGYLARPPRYPVQDLPVVRNLWYMRPEADQIFIGGPADALVALNALDMRHIVVHWADLAPQQRERMPAVLAQALPGVEPAYSDAAITAYRVPVVPLRTYGYFGSGWYQQEQQGTRTWRWMQADGVLTLVNPTETARLVTLDLQAESYREPISVDIALNSQAIGQWVVQPSTTSTRLNLLLAPGTHTLELRAPTVLGDDGRTLSIVLTAVRLEEQ